MGLADRDYMRLPQRANFYSYSDERRRTTAVAARPAPRVTATRAPRPRRGIVGRVGRSLLSAVTLGLL